MKFRRRQFLYLAAGAAALPVASRTARAQAYPTRPITIILPVPPGGGTDAIARILAEHMRTSLGQPLIVESVTGAGGSLAVTRATRSAPDGYTVSMGSWLSHVGTGAIYPVKYDILRDLEPVARIAAVPLVLTARKDFPANDLNEVVAWLKANPGKASFATIGPGSASNVTAVYFQRLTGTDLKFVPYRGAAPAMQDVVAGHVDFHFSDGGGALPFVRAGQVKTYGVTSKSRWFALPDKPTMDEAGAPGLELSFWHGFWVPKETPREIIAKLNSAVVSALSDPLVRARLIEIGQEIPIPDQQTPAALAAYHKSEIEKWWPIIKAANIKGE
jgi:tripartite-type tricarboxylate transporter receptor subunit TctC